MESTTALAMVAGVLVGFGLMAIIITINNAVERRSIMKRRLRMFE